MELKFIYEAEVLHNIEIAHNIMKLTMLAPQAAADARAGQFINVYPKSDRLILPRPISICGADPDKGTLTIVYDVVGAGTEELKAADSGAVVRISSPLGNGFPMPEAPGKPVLLVGGGVGTAPMVFLAGALSEYGADITAVTGFRQETFLTEELKSTGCRTLVTTDLPTEHAFLGNVIDCMQINRIVPDSGWTCYACGPRPMLEALCRYIYGLDKGASLYVSLEERMGCGYGACVGCVADVRDGKDSSGRDIIRKLKVCKDGPVFNGEAVVW